MLYNVIEDDGAMTLEMAGRMDTKVAMELDSFLRVSLERVEALIFDCRRLEYICSAGLRMLLYAHKTMAKQGSMKIVGCNEDIMEIFRLTGFSDLLNIEQDG